MPVSPPRESTRKAVESDHIVLCIFKNIASTGSFAKLQQTCKRFRKIATENQAVLLRTLAQRLYQPRAIQLLSTCRIIGKLEFIHFVRYGGRVNFPREGSREHPNGVVRGFLTNTQLDRRPNQFGKQEFLWLRSCTVIAEKIHSQIAEKLKLEGKTLDSLDTYEIKKAVFTLAALARQFQFTGFLQPDKTIKPASEETLRTSITDLAKLKPETMTWTYNYFLAARLSIRDLFRILSLGEHIDPEAIHWPALDMLLPPGSTNSDFNSASLLRFAAVNLFNVEAAVKGDYYSFTPAGSIGTAFRRAIQNAFGAREKWERAITELVECKRKHTFQRGYNTKYFTPHRTQPAPGKPEKFSLLVKEDAWYAIGEAERDLMACIEDEYEKDGEWGEESDSEEEDWIDPMDREYEREKRYFKMMVEEVEAQAMADMEEEERTGRKKKRSRCAYSGW
ncbi:hypothetical protein BJ508DRAFT_413202 [Ascobolus immersus RN42]|uniref:F-box domain-containing protein n=1 Tax=Ascobolus immersus RN42 TaxID=1160509 RepID=A0A3N4II87_ASCIM|nr:hypothetical protein BJ508DRAFT_413202 [Ascobolus immersus RN42]